MMDAPSLPKPTVSIDVASDVVCPWCYLGKRRLERAITLVPEVDTIIRWHPFQLDPTIPQEGIDRAEYLTRKFGDPARIRAVHERLAEMGRRDGIDYQFDRIAVSPNTIDAHRLVRWTREAEREGDMVERLFRAYFAEGRDIGDRVVLAQLAGEVGLDERETVLRLATSQDRAEVQEEIESAHRIGVTGVPCFIIDRRYAVMGAEAPETIAESIRQAIAARPSAPATVHAS